MNLWSRVSKSCKVLIAVAVIGVTGCKKPEDSGGASAGGSGGDIPIGEFASLTGKEAAFGQSSHKGTQLAIEEINNAGGVLGRKLKLITEDTQSKQGESVTGVRKLISKDGVVAVLGEVASGRSLEGASVCQPSKIPMISPSSTNPRVTKAGDYIFRVCFTDEFQGKVLAKFGSTTLKLKNVAVLSDVTAAYSQGLAEYFINHFKSGGGQIAVQREYSGGDKDFRAQLTAIRSANADGIFLPGYYNDVGLIVAQARQLGMTMPIFGGDGWEAPQLYEIGGEALKDTYYTTHFYFESTEPKVQEFVKSFKAKFWKLSQVTLLSAHEEMAYVCGIQVKALNYLFILVLTITVALSIRLLGIILVTALLVVPPAAARNLSRNLRQQIILSLILGLVGGVVGIAASYELNVPCGPAIVLASILLFIITLALGKIINRPRSHETALPSVAS